MRPPIFRASLLADDEMVCDHFAGAGGASEGLELALGRVDLAVNHCPEALAVHAANHPRTRHLLQDVWEVKPREVCAGRRVGLAWFSPDCTFFSRAKGGKPRDKRVRSLAWVVVRWAREVKPRVIMLENVPEFETWGPLDNDGFPDPRRAGLTFKVWVGKLRALGYRVEWRQLVAADYGAPTTRKRLFVIARCDGEPIVWPEPTHDRLARGLPRWRGAHEVIDWSIPCPSIFDRRRPLAEATLERIAKGVRRYVLDTASPFIVPVKSWGGGGNEPRSIELPLRTITSSKRGEFALVAPLLTKAFGGPNGNTNAGIDVRDPLGTITAQDHHHLAAAFLTKFYGTSTGSAMQQPLPTITGGGQHIGEVRAFLVKYYGQGSQQQSLFEPLHTVTAKARFGLVMVKGEPYQVADIGMRMLEPRELKCGQGFRPDYDLAPTFEGKPLSKTMQTFLVGNSVSPMQSFALACANFYPRDFEAVA
jgi:DNA (cytosine-5)-methyltransferase 1